MAVAVWPSQVPVRPVVNGMELGQGFVAPLSSETEGGPPIMRPRPGPRATEMPWRSEALSPAQWEAFEQFVRVNLRQGTLPFTMPVWRPGGFVARICQIKGGVYSTDLSVAWRVRVSLTRIVYNL